MKAREVFASLWASLDTYKKGFSARKLTAWYTMVLVTLLDAGYLYIGYQKDNFKSFPTVLGMHLLFILLLLGIVTASHIISFKNAERTGQKDIGNTQDDKGKGIEGGIE